MSDSEQNSPQEAVEVTKLAQSTSGCPQQESKAQSLKQVQDFPLWGCNGPNQKTLVHPRVSDPRNREPEQAQAGAVLRRAAGRTASPSVLRWALRSLGRSVNWAGRRERRSPRAAPTRWDCRLHRLRGLVFILKAEQQVLI